MYLKHCVLDSNIMSKEVSVVNATHCVPKVSKFTPPKDKNRTKIFAGWQFRI